jgi:hypothetical protein
MSSGLEFRINQHVVYDNFETASIGRDESDAFNVRFDALKKFVCQANGPVGIMSDGTIGDGYGYQFTFSCFHYSKIILRLAKIGELFQVNHGIRLHLEYT